MLCLVFPPHQLPHPPNPSIPAPGCHPTHRFQPQAATQPIDSSPRLPALAAPDLVPLLGAGRPRMLTTARSAGSAPTPAASQAFRQAMQSPHHGGSCHPRAHWARHRSTSQGPGRSSSRRRECRRRSSRRLPARATAVWQSSRLISEALDLEALCKAPLIAPAQCKPPRPGLDLGEAWRLGGFGFGVGEPSQRSAHGLSRNAMGWRGFVGNSRGGGAAGATEGCLAAARTIAGAARDSGAACAVGRRHRTDARKPWVGGEALGPRPHHRRAQRHAVVALELIARAHAHGGRDDTRGRRHRLVTTHSTRRLSAPPVGLRAGAGALCAGSFFLLGPIIRSCSGRESA